MLKSFRPVVFSRHPTHNVLRTKLPLLPFRSIIRLGSTTEVSKKMQSKGTIVECNPIEGIINTSDKIRMKSCFTKSKINSPEWYLPVIVVGDSSVCNKEYFRLPSILEENNPLLGNKPTIIAKDIAIKDDMFPLIAKINFHSRGRGMMKIDNREQLLKLLEDVGTARKYTFEKYINYVREYRVHATRNGIFYICRKLRKEEAKDRWFFNSKNSIFKIIFEDGKWIGDKIPCFTEMENHCKLALEALKMDIAGFDVRVNATGEKFTIIEANSACSFGEHTAQHYIKMIPEVLKNKFEKLTK